MVMDTVCRCTYALLSNYMHSVLTSEEGGSISIMMLEIVANPELQDVQSISNHNVRFSLYWS